MPRAFLLLAALCSLTLPSCGGDDPAESLAERAAQYRTGLGPREVLGTIQLTSESAPVVVRAGADQAGIDRGGAGWYQETGLPGEGRPISMGGHRTTHGAPFRALGTLGAGDQISFELPYATATYEVVRTRRVHKDNVEELTRGDTEELRLFASTIPAGFKRLFVYAKPTSIQPD
jgi:LPXTG-site transpeptidase (sortase) family protein